MSRGLFSIALFVLFFKKKPFTTRSSKKMKSTGAKRGSLSFLNVHNFAVAQPFFSPLKPFLVSNGVKIAAQRHPLVTD